MIDAAFVTKDASGNADAMEVTQLDPDVQEGLEEDGHRSPVGCFSEDDLMSVGRGARAELVGSGSGSGERVGPQVAQSVRDAGGVLSRVPAAPA